MTGTSNRSEAVIVIRAQALTVSKQRSTGRATVFDFAGTGGQKTWIGSVTLAAKANTGAHHHGRHEVAVYVAKGRSEIRWGERLEFRAEVGPGDFVYFAPYVPHQERNLSDSESLDFVVVRSDNENIVVKLDSASVV